MKVVEIVLDLHSRAGVEVFFESLVQKLSSRKDIELTVISLWDDVHESFSQIKTIPGVSFYSLGKKKGIDFRAAKKLRRIIKNITPDIINTHRSILLTYFLAFGFRRKPWKIIHTIHNVPNMESNRITNFLRRVYIRKKMIYFVGISDRITNLFKTSNPKAEVVTIYNGVSLKKIGLPETKKYSFINIARFSEQKNHKLLFDAFEIVHQKHNDATLICLGDGELFDFYRDYISNLSSKESITLYGATREVYHFLKQSCIFVLSSRYEGNPISILEAMNCGIPVIAPNVGGIPDVIKNERNGLIYGVNDLEELSLSMINLFENKEKQLKISAQNIIDVGAFSMDKCFENYYNFFRKVVDEAKK